MEIDPDQLDLSKECIDHAHAEQVISSGSPVTNDIFGDPQVLPRVGDKYQVEIPPLMSESDCLRFNEDAMPDAGHSPHVGFPIPVVWINNGVIKIKYEPPKSLADSDDAVSTSGSVELENSKESQIGTKHEDPRFKFESFDTLLGYGKRLGGPASRDPLLFDDKVGDKSAFSQKRKKSLDQCCSSNGYSPAPGSLGDSWNDTEQNSFLLGLFIFGKNLVQVKKFTESKKMGDVLSFYYGKFYRSEGHRRWSECRKIRSKRCINGQRIFTGWRQQEFLSRLLLYISEECKKSLMEVSRIFGEGKLSLEEYVFTLKATVGMNVLVEAVGIGKGKQDLTGIVMETIKPNQVFSLHPDIPIGKACSNLTSGDIIKFLTGDFRLSKTRSNDLFWEAVWPRLLARGWHSEQPKNCSYAGSRNSLVFLIPGIKKFSRRRLVKGNHYFDSVSDVLNKVAADPRLLEFEFESAKDSISNEEFGRDAERKLDHYGFSDHQRHCYLQPRISNCNQGFRKFTIVDTSFVSGEESHKMIELRNLPVDTTNASIPSCPSSESDGDTSDEPLDELDSADILLNHQVDGDPPNLANGLSDKGLPSDFSDCVINVLNKGMPINCLDPMNLVLDNHKHQSTNLSNEKQPRKPISCQFSQRVKPSHINYLAPVMKRRRLNARSNAETRHNMNSFFVGSRRPKMLQCHSNSLDAHEKKVSPRGPSQEMVQSTGSSDKGTPDEGNKGILSESFLDMGLSHEKYLPRTLIDLNIPHVMPDSETGENLIMEVEDIQKDSSAKRSLFPLETCQQQEALKALRTSDGGDNAEQQPIISIRRQSTRNRPLTSRALEALACGFFNSTRRRRGTGAMLGESMISRPCRRPRGRVGVATNFGSISCITDSKLEAGVDGECESTHKFGNQPERECAQELLQGEKGGFPEVLMCKEEHSG